MTYTVCLTWLRLGNDRLTSLTAAPLSQNGFDNSGQRLDKPGWTQGDSVSATQRVIQQISDKYGSGSYDDVVVGIELLNEPVMASLTGGKSATQGYYEAGAKIVHGSGSVPVIISDGFATSNQWNGVLTGQGSSGAIVDHHEYQVFTNALVSMSPEEHVNYVKSNANSWATGQDKFVICGEFTAAMTDCAPALNGYGIGARYDGTYSKRNADGSYDSSNYVGSCGSINFIDQWSEYNKTSTTNYIKAQLDTFESMIQGWIFWNFKTETAAEWDLFRLLDNGIWPSMS